MAPKIPEPALLLAVDLRVDTAEARENF